MVFWTCQRVWNRAGSFRRTSRSQFDHLGNSEDQGADKASIEVIWRFPTCPRAFQHHPKFALDTFTIRFNSLIRLGLLWFATVDDEVFTIQENIGPPFFRWEPSCLTVGPLSPLEVWDSWPRIPKGAKRPQRGSNALARPRWKNNRQTRRLLRGNGREWGRFTARYWFFCWRSPTRIFRCLVSGLTSQFSLLWLETNVWEYKVVRYVCLDLFGWCFDGRCACWHCCGEFHHWHAMGGAVRCHIYFARRVESSTRLTVPFAYRPDIFVENLIVEWFYCWEFVTTIGGWVILYHFMIWMSRDIWNFAGAQPWPRRNWLWEKTCVVLLVAMIFIEIVWRIPELLIWKRWSGFSHFYI